jgi:hypothetical protein
VEHDQNHLKQTFRVAGAQSHLVACMVSQLGEADDDTVTVLKSLTQPKTSKMGMVQPTMLLSIHYKIKFLY